MQHITSNGRHCIRMVYTLALVLQATLLATYRSSGDGEPTTSSVTKPHALKVRKATYRDQILQHGVSGNHRTSSTCHNDIGLWYAPLKLIVTLMIDITIDIFVLNTIIIIVFVGVVISVTIIVPSFVSMSPSDRCLRHHSVVVFLFHKCSRACLYSYISHCKFMLCVQHPCIIWIETDIRDYAGCIYRTL